MNSEEFKQYTLRLEELLKTLTIKSSLKANEQSELDKISDLIADYEEEHYPFKVESLA